MIERDNEIQELIKRIIKIRERFVNQEIRGIAHRGDLRKPTQQLDLISDPYTGTIGVDNGPAGP